MKKRKITTRVRQWFCATLSLILFSLYSVPVFATQQFDVNGEVLETGNNTPMVPWGVGLSDEEWLLDETMGMMPILPTIRVSELDVSAETLATLSAAGFELDADGDGIVDQSFVDGLMRTGIKSIINGGGVDAIIDWGADQLLDYIFGSESNNIANALEQINSQLAAIREQLDQVLKALEKVLKEVEINNYKADRADASAVRDPLQNAAETFRIELRKAGKDQRARKAALERFNNMQIDGKDIYTATMNLGDTIIRTNNHSGKDLYHMSYALAMHAHFPFDYQTTSFFHNTNNYYMVTYLEMLSYCKLSLHYQLEKYKNNKAERIHYEALFEKLFTGDGKGIEANAKKILTAYEAGPKLEIHPNMTTFTTDKTRYTFLRKTDFGAPTPARVYQISLITEYPDPNKMYHHTLINHYPFDNIENAWYHHLMSEAEWKGFSELFKTKDLLGFLEKNAGLIISKEAPKDRVYLRDHLQLAREITSLKTTRIYGRPTNGRTGEFIYDAPISLVEFRGFRVSLNMVTMVNHATTIFIYNAGSSVPPDSEIPMQTLRGVVSEIGEDGLFQVIPTTDEGLIGVANQATAIEDLYTEVRLGAGVVAQEEDASAQPALTEDLKESMGELGTKETTLRPGDTVEMQYYPLDDGQGGTILSATSITVLDREAEEEPQEEATVTGALSTYDENVIVLHTKEGDEFEIALSDSTIYVGMSPRDFLLGDVLKVTYSLGAPGSMELTAIRISLQSREDAGDFIPVPNPMPDDGPMPGPVYPDGGEPAK